MELRYEGQAIDPALRLRTHRQARSSNSHLNYWLRKTQWSMIPLEQDPPDLDEAEIRWIQKMRKQGARLLNITNGGNTRPSGYHHSAETRTKIKDTLMGRPGHPQSTATCTKISVAKKGHLVSAATRAKIRAALTGHRHTPEARAKMSATRRARQHSSA